MSILWLQLIIIHQDYQEIILGIFKTFGNFNMAIFVFFFNYSDWYHWLGPSHVPPAIDKGRGYNPLMRVTVPHSLLPHRYSVLDLQDGGDHTPPGAAGSDRSGSALCLQLRERHGGLVLLPWVVEVVGQGESGHDLASR